MNDKQIMDWFEEFIGGSHHTRVFLTSKQKMHPDGVALWDEALGTAKDILANLREKDARKREFDAVIARGEYCPVCHRDPSRQGHGPRCDTVR